MWTIKPTDKGIGLRSEHLELLCQQPKRADIDFLELAPENWLEVGGYKQECLEHLANIYPMIAHGLNLSIGDTQPLNVDYVKRVKQFLDLYHIDIYSDHISFSADSKGYLYDLLPIPRYKECIDYIVDRIKAVQDIIERPMVLENISYYHSYPNEMPEEEFIATLIEKSQCRLLLDINNVYVNSKNHHYDPLSFVKALPTESLCYYHIAGHLKERDNYLIDTHGKSVSTEVIEFGKQVVQHCGAHPLLLERDHFLPPLEELCSELQMVYQHLYTDDSK